MPGSSDFEHLFGKFRWEIPAEVRILESEMKNANQVDLRKFESEVIENVKILQSIAEERLKDRDQLLNIVLTDYSTISEPSNKEKFADQTKNLDSIRNFDIEKNEAKYQAAVNEVEQLLKNRLDQNTIREFSRLPTSASNKRVQEEKAKIAKEIAQEVYDTEQFIKTPILWEFIRNRCCPSLQLVSDDVFEITKSVVPVLLPLSLSGIISVPLQPMLYAWAVLIIARLGIKNFCGDFINKNTENLGVIKTMTENSRIINTGGGNYIESNSGTYVQGNYINMSPDLAQAATQIQDLITQLQNRGITVDVAQEQVAQDMATQAQNNSTIKTKLVKWGQSLGDATVSDVVKGVVKLAIRSAGIPLP